MKKEIFLGKNLSFLSNKEKIALTTLAKRIGMNASTLHNYYQSVEPRNIKALSNLADFFGYSLDEILFKDLESNSYELNETKKLETPKGICQLTINIQCNLD